MNDNSLKNIKKWNKMLEGQGNNVVNNIEKIKLEAELMNDKAENINQLIKLESLKNPKQDESKPEEPKENTENTENNSQEQKPPE